jgi:hypothetical protein
MLQRESAVELINSVLKSHSRIKGELDGVGRKIQELVAIYECELEDASKVWPDERYTTLAAETHVCIADALYFGRTSEQHLREHTSRQPFP